MLTAEKEHWINFRESSKKFCLSFNYNGANSYIFVDGAEIFKFKAKDSEVNATPWCLGNVSNFFSMYNIKETGFHKYVNDFSVLWCINLFKPVKICFNELSRM